VRKVTKALLLSLVFALLLGTAVSAAPITIEFWHAMGGVNGEALETIVNNFNNSQSEIVVDLQFQGSYYDLQQKFLASIAARRPPALIQLPIEGAGVFGPTGALEDLTPYLENDPEINFDYFIPGLLADSYYQDEFLGIPFNRSNPVLFYNKAHFAEAGLGTEPPETWEELVEYAKALTVIDETGRVVRHGFSPNLHWWTLIPMIWSNGGNLADPETGKPTFDTPEVAEVLQLISDMVNVHRTAKVYAGTVFSASNRARDDFNAGKISMWINSIANVGSIDPNLDYATAFVPRFKDGEHTVPNGGGSLFVAASATKEQKDAAWKVIKYFVSPEQQAYWSRITGYMPASFVAVNTPEMQQFYAEKPMYKTAIDQLQYAKGVPSSEIFLDIIDVFESAVQEVVISQSDPAEVLEAAIKLIHY
jgi:sn-glycerol 3-phosphate transport system substrate-binding protein